MERIYNGDKWLLIHSDNKVHFSFGSANANAFISRSSPSERQKLLPRSLLFMHIVFVRNPFSCECGRKNQSEKNNKVERNPWKFIMAAVAFYAYLFSAWPVLLFFLPLLQVSLLCFNSNKVLVLHIFYAVLCVYYKHINTIDTKAVANYCSDS